MMCSRRKNFQQNAVDKRPYNIMERRPGLRQTVARMELIREAFEITHQ